MQNTLGRPIKLTDNQSTVDWAKDVFYNAAGQITQMKHSQDTSGSSYYTETRTFNVLQQLTRLTVPGVLDHPAQGLDLGRGNQLPVRQPQPADFGCHYRSAVGPELHV